jgi:hypothetical protein
MKVCPMNDPVWRPEILLEFRYQVGQPDRLSTLPTTEDDLSRLDGDGSEAREEAPSSEESCHIGSELNPSSDL